MLACLIWTSNSLVLPEMKLSPYVAVKSLGSTPLIGENLVSEWSRTVKLTTLQVIMNVKSVLSSV